MRIAAIQPEKKIYKYLFYLILTVLMAYSAFSIYASTRQMYWDFPNYYVSANLLSQGESVGQFYDNLWFENKASEMGIEHPARFNPFPPITSVLMLPLSGFEPLVAKRIWIAINALLLVLTVRLISRLFLFDYALSAFFLLLTGASLALNFRLGQYYLVILFLLLLVYGAYKKGKLRSSALLLSVITVIKYFPVVFIVGFLKRKYLLYFGTGTIVLILVQWAVFGTDAIQTYIGVLQNHLGGKIDGQEQASVSFQSFNSFFTNVFVGNSETGVSPIINWPLGKMIATLLVLFIVGGSALYAVYQIYRDGQSPELIMIITAMAAMVALPASASYHYVLLLFPFLLLMKWKLGQGHVVQSLLITILFILVTNVLQIPIPNTGLYFLDLILDYPRLWSMTILYFYSLKIILQSKGEVKRFSNQKLSYKHLLGEQLQQY